MEGSPRRFGDAHSSLLDEFERLTFEIKLNQAILGRSHSEPNMIRSLAPQVPQLQPMVSQVPQGRRTRLLKVMKKLFSPILSRKPGRREDPDPKKSLSFKTFSRSLRV